jgi:hypothetical protein
MEAAVNITRLGQDSDSSVCRGSRFGQKGISKSLALDTLQFIPHSLSLWTYRHATVAVHCYMVG